MRALSWVAALVAIAAVAPALAQETDLQRFPAQRLRGVEDGYGLFSVHTGEIPGHLNWDVGLMVDYASSPLVLRLGDDRVGELLLHRAGAEFSFAIGLLDYLAIEAAIPAVVFQQRGAVPHIDESALPELAPAGLSDPRIVAKLRLLREDRHFVSLSFAPTLTLPGGVLQSELSGGSLSYLGETGPTLVPELALSSRRFLGTIVALNLGFRVRGTTTLQNLSVREEILYRLGVGYDLRYFTDAIPLSFLAELNGATGTGERLLQDDHTPLEWLAGLRFEPIPGLQIYAAGGSGLIAGWGTPDLRILAGLRYGTRGVDSDGDGIDDSADGCPDQPEDADGFEDSDGCPDPDNDSDGVTDKLDRCTFEAEDRDGYEDGDGCPDPDNDADGVLDTGDACPDEKGPPSKQGCPSPDSDGDGVHDHKDRCLAELEDRDGFEDDDGCPDPDNDGDGLPDGADPCPNDAEDKDGFEDRDGCPELDNDKDGIPDLEDKCPDDAATPERARLGEGCPPRDSDGDGLFDEEDPCPADAEDLDGFEDEDGCPDIDNDRDGIVDEKDKCPLKPETINGIKDKDGCPDRGKQLVILTKDKIEIRDKIFFKSGSAKIRRRSFKLLDQIAQVLRGHVEIKKVRVEGHTDDRGKDKRNKKLSQRRAESVALYLIEAGIDPTRLEAVGYGEEKPITDNGTKAGREQNRRVEFTILKKE